MRKLSRPAFPVGLAPGTLKPSRHAETARVRVTSFDYDASSIEEHTLERNEDIFRLQEPGLTRWINVDGIHDADLIGMFGDHFNLHPLMLEDMVTVSQRSKVEHYNDSTYIVVRMLRFDEAEQEIQSEQISLVIVGDTLITLQEREGDVFDRVRARLRAGRPRIRAGGPCYLAYALLDAIVDHYFILLEQIGAYLETIEDQLVSGSSPDTLHAIHRLKGELIFLRKSVWPLREAVNTMLRDDDLPFSGELQIYLRDLYDHTVHVMETIDSYRDLNNGMLDTYMSIVGNRMNEVMKTLTVIATIFIPLTFIVGVYGMNFEHMPELRVRWAYPVVWLVMILTVAIMLRYFRRKSWM